MDGKRYVHDVVVSASLGPFMALRAGQDVLENAKRRTARTGKAGGSKDGGAMKRIYYIDGMTIEEAKTWTKDGLHCMTPIRPDDELSRLFSDMSFEHAQYVSPDGSEHGLAFGRREKSSFFLRHGAPTGRRLIMSSVHALDADGCRDAVRHVEETHRAVRDAARPIETRLNCDSHPRLRYYHKIFLRALSAAMQNVFVAQGLASGRRFDESPEALDAFCLAQFESLLEDLVDLLEKAPRENTRRVGPGVPWIGEDYQLIIRRTQLTHDMLRDDEERDD
ncbi:uncharacterized protein LOC119109506 [Pollicipes pollicipes]|uniref:uncharacterized protein LOC119109506 n=1 Tax=Pollicipes pollicipes TaxID=41117 RepID=UPI001885A224|nr:uncharacterized protein LOC119109506 [Pollicipes pollicipes]